MHSAADAFQLSLRAAELYESAFVPALFADWAPHLVDAAGIAPGTTVLDVACGTGIVARTAAERVGGDGAVTGLDLNEAMLTVARRVRPDLDWRQGDAEQLPFPDDRFDVTLCQMALMFMPDRAQALREMRRVTRPGGTVGIVVPASLDLQPAYGPFVEIAVRHAGPDARALLGTYWACGDLEALRGLIESAGLVVQEARTRTGTARFASIDEMVTTEVEGSPLRERIDPDVYRRIRDETRERLVTYAADDGTAAIPLAGHIVICGVHA